MPTAGPPRAVSSTCVVIIGGRPAPRRAASPSRSRVILRCSSAAIRSSSSGSFCSRPSSISSISLGRLARRADDENVPEARLVVAIRLGQPRDARQRRRAARPPARRPPSSAYLPTRPTRPTFARTDPPSFARPAPIRGCAANASSQSAASSDAQTASAGHHRRRRSANGRAAAIACAQRVEPQHRSSARRRLRRRARSGRRGACGMN